MLLHLEPHLISPFRNVALVSLTLEPFGLRLAGGVDLIVGRPYPNKRHAVACRKTKSRKAFYGFLVETSSPVDEWRMTAVWGVGAVQAAWGTDAKKLVTHEVEYRLLDHDFDAASENMVLWYGSDKGGWSNRWPEWARNLFPLLAAPVMEVVPDSLTARRLAEDTFDAESGMIVKRFQSFSLPTIEPGRLTGEHHAENPDRMPPLETAFQVAGANGILH